MTEEKKNSYSESRKRASIKYAKENLKRIPLDVKLSVYCDIQAHAEAHGESLNGFIKRAIMETMERDNAQEVAK